MTLKTGGCIETQAQRKYTFNLNLDNPQPQ